MFARISIRLILLINLSAMALGGEIEIDFDINSLRREPGSYDFSYPGLEEIIVNDRLSLPVKTLYLETDLPNSVLTVRTVAEDTIELDQIPEDIIHFDTTTTGSTQVDFELPVPGPGCLSEPVYNIQRLGNGTRQALSILPITIDEQRRVLFAPSVRIGFEGEYARIMSRAELTAQYALRGGRKITGIGEDSRLIGDENESASYVIVTSENLRASFEPLVVYKNSIGISTQIETIESILENYPGLDAPEKLRNYLFDFYNSGGCYVLLGGDEQVLPVRYLYYYNTNSQPSNPYVLMPSDLYFADLTGTWDLDGDGVWGEPSHDAPDIIPELKVGRLPVRDPAAIENYVNKLIQYETNPGNGDFDYLTRVLFFSSDQMRDYPAEGQHGYIAQRLPSHIIADTGLTVEQPDGYDENPTNPNGDYGVQKISEGYGLVHILAHGRVDGYRMWAPFYGNGSSSLILTWNLGETHGDLSQLEKNGRTSLYYSLSCQVGGYELDSINGESASNSLAEFLIAADRSGAVGMIGYARWGWVYSSYHLEASFTEHLYGDAEGSPVEAMTLSWIDFPYYRDLIYGQNYFGDPSLTFYRERPGRMDVMVEAKKGAYEIQVRNESGPVSDASITISSKGVILEQGLSGGNGQYTTTTEFELGTEYCIAAAKEGFTIAREFFTPTITSGTDDPPDDNLPECFSLKQNYPNPFNPATVIAYELPRRSRVELRIFNILGQEVYAFETDNQPPGCHEITWDGTDMRGDEISSGIYIYRLRTDEFADVKKMILIK